MTTQDRIQGLFLEEIKKKLPPNLSFVDELAELLSISRDSAYRRIRGETVLSLDEAKKLCERYGVSIDALFAPESGMIPFLDRTPSSHYSLSQWLNSIYQNMGALTEITYAAKDIPIFHYFRQPELCAFKMFFWQKSIVEASDFAKVHFESDVISKEMIQLGNRIWERYAAIPSDEIWADEVINNTLKEIGFYHECGFFVHPQQAAQLCDQLIELIHTIQGEAANAKKTEGTTFQLYQNEILTSDNTVFARAGHKSLAYVNYNTLSLLVTQHASFCEKTESYLNNLIKHSTLISGTAEKERIKFFTKMTNHILNFKKSL